jgi:hypothetical protein
MSISPTQILHQPLILLDVAGGALRIANGIAVLDWSMVTPSPAGPTHADVVFDVPLFGPAGGTAGPPSLSALAYPATFDAVANAPGTKAMGWGVNQTVVVWHPFPQTVRLTISVLAKSGFVEMVRVGFQVTAAFQP